MKIFIRQIYQEAGATLLLSNDVKIFGPNIRRKAGEVEFSIHVPYQKKETHIEEISYALDKIAEGISMAFEQYDISSYGIKDASMAAVNDFIKKH